MDAPRASGIIGALPTTTCPRDRVAFVRLLVGVAVAMGYAVLAIVLTWPLASHLTTDLPGDPTGDTGVYVWNLWIFRHEFLDHGHLPFTTRHIFAFTGGADFSLHNYTPIASLLGLPLIPLVGVVGAFNVVLMAVLALSGAGTYLLARLVGLARLGAWAAGAMFMAAPLISARETAHLSLVTNAALPLFVWALLRTLDRPSRPMGVLVGVLVAGATYSDAYYGVYCVLMGLFLLAWRFLRVEWRTPSILDRRTIAWLDGLAVVLLAVALVPRVMGVTDLEFAGLSVRGLSRPYAPMLALVLVGTLRLYLTRRPSLRPAPEAARVGELFTPGLVAVGTCLLLLSPLMAGLAERYVQGRLPDTHTYWRSSPRGVDLLAYVVPNPTHAVFGRWTERWLLPDVEDAFPELVASFSIVAIAVVGIFWALRALPRMWVSFTALFVALSLGPFIHVGGVNTFMAGPWALLRYVPVIGMARSPSRFAIVAALGLSLLFAFALQAWLCRQWRWTLLAVACVACGVIVEVTPAPRLLHSAAVPDVYSLIAGAEDDRGALLELPTGIRDGTSSIGDFNASTAYFQTRHGRPFIGGYLSRVSEWRKRESLRSPMLRALFELSGGAHGLDPELVHAARESRQTFLSRSCVHYVIVDKLRASHELRAFATDALQLESIHEDERYQLLSPVGTPPCDSPRPMLAAGWPRRQS